ncbi:hypothetical protein DAEQUDRAFT_663249 [Daedalea quercina L-15889]|uniref:Adipose-regulatory protein n=1 Tax=Daedalea quercina L-15889 TaxID=1314783 RepID=A0A165T142_9APHY|nr:hypothetical protein DAEQUDRAFT_663249 [Daedalea quercina L-15889]
MAAIFRVVSPYTTNLIPLVVFLLSIPVIAFLSASAGYLVWRSVAVGWETDVVLQYGDGVPPYAEFALPDLVVVGQPYDVSLQLTVPASESNLALGNFMASLLLTTPQKDNTLAYARKPAIVLPPSYSLRSLMYSGLRTVDMDIPLLSSFSLDSKRVVARVELGRRDQWKSTGSGEGRELTVFSAMLRGVVVHKGFRGLISRFPVFTAVVASCTFLFLSFVVLAACLLPALELRFDSDPHFNDPPPPRPKHSRRHTSVATNSDAGISKSPQSPRTTQGRRRSGAEFFRPPERMPFKEEEMELDPFDPSIDPEMLPPDLKEQYYMARAAQLEQLPEGSSASEQSIPATGGASSAGEERNYPRRRRSRQTLQDSDGD